MSRSRATSSSPTSPASPAAAPNAEFPDDPLRAELIRLVGDGLVLGHLTGQPTHPEAIARIRTTLPADDP